MPEIRITPLTSRSGCDNLTTLATRAVGHNAIIRLQPADWGRIIGRHPLSTTALRMSLAFNGNRWPMTFNPKKFASDGIYTVEPWSYNPSSWQQRIPMCVIAAVAFAISAYMALYQWRLIDSVWDPIFGQQTANVLDSDVSDAIRRWILIPDAALGALAYLGDVVFGLAGNTRRWRDKPWLVIIFGINVIPVGIVSAILVFMQGAVVGQWCFLCLVTAVLSLLLVYIAYDEVCSSLLYLYRIRQRTDGSRAMWQALWGKPTAVAQRIGDQMLHENRDKKQSGGSRSRQLPSA